MLRKERNNQIIFLLVVVIFSVSLLTVAFFLKNYNESSPEAVTNAEFTANDGQELRAVKHTIITDMDTGIQYVYFEGYGVSPLITEDGTVSKTVE